MSGVIVEAALFCYPWVLADEGIDEVVAAARSWHVTHLWVASLYHAGFFLYPHNPRRRAHLLEDGVAYFHPQLPAYEEGPLQPCVASLCRERDWFGEVCARAVSAGLRVCAWTVFCHNTRLGLAHPEATIHNAFGDSYAHALSPGHPHTVAYCRALAGDLARRYPLDGVLVEAGDYRRRRHGADWVSGHHHERDGVHLRPLEAALLDLSFNPADMAHAEARGIDAPALRAAVCRHLERCFDAAPGAPPEEPTTMEEFAARHPALALYTASLLASDHALWAELHSAVRDHGVRLIGAPRPSVDLVLNGAYGQPAERIEATAAQARQALQPHQQLAVGLRLGFDAPGMGAAITTQAQLVQATQAAVRGGAQVVAYYNHAEAPRRSLEWIGPALSSVGLTSPVGE